MVRSRRPGTARRAAAALLGLAPAVTPGLAQAAPQGSTVYVLTPESSLQEGCFPPCLCPMLAPVGTRGTFRLGPGEADGATRTFPVTGVDWLVPVLGRRLTGSGVYTLTDGSPPEQRLVLDLSTNGGPAERFDSGRVPAAAPFPAIEALLSIRGLRCYDTAIEVASRPAPAGPFIHALEEGVLGWSPADGGSSYDVIRGDLGALIDRGGDFVAATEGCIADDEGGLWASVPDLPAPGRAIWFLVRAAGASYDGAVPPQAASRDAGIAASGRGCP